MVKSETLKMLQSPKQLESLLTMVKQLQRHTEQLAKIIIQLGSRPPKMTTTPPNTGDDRRGAQNAPPYASRIRWEVDLHHAGGYGHEKHANRPLSLSRIELRWDPKRTQPRFGITFT